METIDNKSNNVKTEDNNLFTFYTSNLVLRVEYYDLPKNDYG
jgi:hypothetical protein